MKQLFVGVLAATFYAASVQTTMASSPTWWDFQAVDTMKYSRDPSAEFLKDPARLEEVADQQVKEIARISATHVGIATPYDEQFLPVMKAWVNAARKYNLKVWFRGNWSGWERWFGYDPITRDEHIAKTVEFIKSNPTLFEDGDYFSACPECENGGPGDPRMNGDAQGHREFLIKEYNEQLKAFRSINKNVQVNLNSMNGDVARLIMDKETTKALGGVVVVDHYVRTPEKLNQDVTTYAELSGGKVILGEFGAPIPDINGTMTEQQQAQWLQESMTLLAENPNLVGVSYWTNMGGSTAIWRDDGTPKEAADVLQSFYTPLIVDGTIVNTLNHPVEATVSIGRHSVTTEKGYFELPYLKEDTVVQVEAKGYPSQEFLVSELIERPLIELKPIHTSFWYSFQAYLLALFSKISQ